MRKSLYKRHIPGWPGLYHGHSYMCVYMYLHRYQHHTVCASAIDAAIHTTSNLESITNSIQVSLKLSKITEDKCHVSEPPDTVHWSFNHRAASWEKKQGPQDMYNVDLPSTIHSITENLAMATTHLDTAYTLYGCTCKSLQ